MSGFTREVVPVGEHQHIVARFFAPAGEPRAAVLVVPAMGVTQAYYAPFAQWLAAQGFLAATFDYRGIGQSRHGSLRKVETDILDWARLDCAAMIDVLTARVQDQPLHWVGHSLGGQILPFVPNRQRVSRVVTVATGSGYWRENTAALRRTSWWLWFVAAPLSVRLFGYFPGKRLRKVGDLPRGVMEQWRRWCLNPEYAVGVEGESARALYAAVQTPLPQGVPNFVANRQASCASRRTAADFCSCRRRTTSNACRLQRPRRRGLSAGCRSGPCWPFNLMGVSGRMLDI